MLLRAVTRRVVVALALVAGAGSVGCTGDTPGTVPDGGIGDVGASEGGHDWGASPWDATASDGPAPGEVATVELPRTPADPKLTRRLVDAPASVVGGDGATCTHQDGATADRLCAFSRPGAAGRTELWVLNVSKAALGAAAPCDGSSANCRRLTENLWTQMPIWGPSHPFAHRFEGDTLIFHADAAPGTRQPYEGAIWAWRDGWAAPRPLTSARGVLCVAQPRTDVVYCLDNAVVDKDPISSFDRPRVLEVDLLAGVVNDNTTGPLAKVARVSNYGAEAAWRVRVSPGGQLLAFSSVPAPGALETLQVIKVADVGQAAPTIVATDTADWEISGDGAKLYFLRGYNRTRGERASGTLMLADFPAGTAPQELASSVLAFELVGAGQDPASGADRGAVIAQGSPPGPVSFALIKDRARPSDLLDLGPEAQAIQVAADARHTLVLKRFPGASFPVAYVTRNDGSGTCQLTQDPSAETYGTGFGDGARSVFWIEYGRNRSESEEGWYARPETCGDRTKFGDFVFGYRLVGSEFVVFEGGDLDDTTSWLQYTPLGPRPGGGSFLPTVIKEHPDPSLDVVRLGAETWVLFSVSQGDAADRGLYLHGPLRTGAP